MAEHRGVDTHGICYATFCTGWMDTFVEEDGGGQKDQKDVIGSGVRRRRCCRSVSLVLIVGLFVSIYLGFVDLSLFNVIEEVDLDAKLTIEVAACDILITTIGTTAIDDKAHDEPSAGAIISDAGTSSWHAIAKQQVDGNNDYGYLFVGYDFAIDVSFTRDAVSGRVTKVRVDNEAGCGHRECSALCSVIVYVPTAAPYAAFIHVKQLTGSPASAVPVAVTAVDATVRRLRVDGGAAKTRFARFHVTENTAVKAGGQPVYAVESDLGPSATLTSSSSSVFVAVDPAALGFETLFVQYRSVNRRACLRAGSNGRSGGAKAVVTAAEATGGDRYAACPLSVSDAGLYSSAAKALVKNFDGNGDLKVTAAEIVDGLATLGVCCGGKCPLVSKCAGLSEEFVPFGTASVPAATFVDAVRRWNSTRLVPKCADAATVRVVAGAGAPPGTSRTWRLETTTGALRLDAAHAFSLAEAAALPRPGYGHDSVLAQAFGRAFSGDGATFVDSRGGGSATGAAALRISASSAQDLAARLRDFDFGEADVFAVMQVVPAPGVPRPS